MPKPSVNSPLVLEFKEQIVILKTETTPAEKHAAIEKIQGHLLEFNKQDEEVKTPLAIAQTYLDVENAATVNAKAQVSVIEAIIAYYNKLDLEDALKQAKDRITEANINDKIMRKGNLEEVGEQKQSAVAKSTTNTPPAKKQPAVDHGDVISENLDSWHRKKQSTEELYIRIKDSVLALEKEGFNDATTASNAIEAYFCAATTEGKSEASEVAYKAILALVPGYSPPAQTHASPQQTTTAELGDAVAPASPEAVSSHGTPADKAAAGKNPDAKEESKVVGVDVSKFSAAELQFALMLAEAAVDVEYVRYHYAEPNAQLTEFIETFSVEELNAAIARRDQTPYTKHIEFTEAEKKALAELNKVVDDQNAKAEDREAARQKIAKLEAIQSQLYRTSKLALQFAVTIKEADAKTKAALAEPKAKVIAAFEALEAANKNSDDAKEVQIKAKNAVKEAKDEDKQKTEKALVEADKKVTLADEAVLHAQTVLNTAIEQEKNALAKVVVVSGFRPKAVIELLENFSKDDIAAAIDAKKKAMKEPFNLFSFIAAIPRNVATTVGGWTGKLGSLAALIQVMELARPVVMNSYFGPAIAAVVGAAFPAAIFVPELVTTLVSPQYKLLFVAALEIFNSRLVGDNYKKGKDAYKDWANEQLGIDKAKKKPALGTMAYAGYFLRTVLADMAGVAGGIRSAFFGMLTAGIVGQIAFQTILQRTPILGALGNVAKNFFNLAKAAAGTAILAVTGKEIFDAVGGIGTRAGEAVVDTGFAGVNAAAGKAWEGMQFVAANPDPFAVLKAGGNAVVDGATYVKDSFVGIAYGVADGVSSVAHGSSDSAKYVYTSVEDGVVGTYNAATTSASNVYAGAKSRTNAFLSYFSKAKNDNKQASPAPAPQTPTPSNEESSRPALRA